MNHLYVCFMRYFYLKLSLAGTLFFFYGCSAYSQLKVSHYSYTYIDPAPFASNAGHWYGIFDKGNVINPLKERPKYRPDDVISIADNILLFQKDNGGWPKNYDIMAVLTPAQKDSVEKSKHMLNTTFDNGTTYTHIAVLSRVYPQHWLRNTGRQP